MIKYFCDVCERPLTRKMLHVFTLTDVEKDTKMQKHLCTACRSKVVDSFRKILAETEVCFPMVTPTFPTTTGRVSFVSGKTNATSAQIDTSEESTTSYEKVRKIVTRLGQKPEWTMSPLLCEQFCESTEEYYEYIRNKCIGMDAGRIVALYKAGWSAKAIIGEIDFNKEDIISEIIFCYEFTGDVPKIDKLPVTPTVAGKSQKNLPEDSVSDEEVEYLVTPDYVAEYVSTLKNHKGISNEIRVAVIKECCKDCSNKARIAQQYDVTQPTVHRLFSEYIKYLNTQYSLDIEEPKYQKGDTPRNLPTDFIDEFMMTLPVRKDTNLDQYKAMMMEALTTDRSLSAIALQHNSSLTVVIKYLNKYADYLKTRS